MTKTIGALPEALLIDEEALFEIEQGGISKKVKLSLVRGTVLPGGPPDLGPVTAEQAEINTRLNQLNDIYGTTVSALASAEFAETARQAAVAARGQAEQIVQGAAQVGIDAIDARNAAQAARDLAATAANDAETAATAAGGYATTATTKADEAAGSASSASASATTATTKAGEAGTSATAASTSANAALSSQNAAASSASSASTSADTASTQASNAASSASAASTSASAAGASQTAAGNSATAAQNSATSASTSAGAAGTSASDASTSASNASTSASNAAGSASTATTQATNAANSATAAGGSATAASGSASSAGTHATNAGNSASAAMASQVSARSTAAMLLPDTFDDPKYWLPSSQLGNSLSSNREYPTDAFTDGTALLVDTSEGKALQHSYAAYGTVYYLARGYQALQPNQTYEMSSRFKYTSGSEERYYGVATFNTAGTYLGIVWFFGATANNAAFVSSTVNMTTNAILVSFSTAAYIKPVMLVGYAGAGAISQTLFLRLRNVTESTNAAIQASAAASSASSASTSAGNASTSATAAQTAETNAGVQAGNASTSASTASGHASAASSSASSAASSATLAATYRDTALGHANNASSSASAASSSSASATAAASAASSSAALAASVGPGVLNKNPTFADWGATVFPTDWVNWSASVSPYVSKVSNGRYGSPNSININSPAGAIYGIYATINSIAPGPHMLEADLGFGAGSLAGALLYVNFYTAAFATYLGTAYIDLNVDLPVSGAVSFAELMWRKAVVAPAGTAAASLIAIQNYPDFGDAAKNLTWRRAAIRPLSSAEAAVMNNAGAVVEVGKRAMAWSEQIVSANGATAAVRMRSETAPGVFTSDIDLVAGKITLRSNADGTERKAMEVVGTTANFYGDVNVGGAVRIGTRRIPIALQSFTIPAADGEAVSFGADLVNIPRLEFNTAALAAKTASQSYDVKGLSLTSTGFTMRAKILTPASPATVTQGPGTNTGGTPSWKLNKASANDSVSGYYTFTATLLVNFGGEPGFYEGYGAYDCYVRPNGGAWTFVGRLSEFAYSGVSGNQSMTIGGDIYYAGAIGQDAGGDYEFGILPAYGAITGFDSVVYSGAGAGSGESSATPAGERVIVTVIPNNQA